jgi:hypothetical protein
VVKTSCLIHVTQRDASEKKLEEELKKIINNQWDWSVRQVDAKEYTTIFPNKISLGTFSKISEILMSLHGIKVRILKTDMDPDATEILQAAWVKIYSTLLFPPAIQTYCTMVKMDWNTSTRSSRLTLPRLMFMWCYGVFHYSVSQESRLSL